MALRELEDRIANQQHDKRAATRKTRRDVAIHDHTTIRTYDYKSGLVRDHRTGKSASIKDVLIKGQIDKLR
jgi:protein subunit release factor A